MQHSKSIENYKARAKTLAAVMSRQNSMKVTISGTQAFQRPGHINIPAGDFGCAEWNQMVNGWIDHELGHVKHSDFDLFKKCHSIQPYGPFLAYLLNIIEDVRMEMMVSKEFRGARVNFDKLMELCVKKNLIKDPSCQTSEISKLFQSVCLYHGRYSVLGQQSLKEYAQYSIDELANLIGNSVTYQVVDLVDSIRFAKNTADSLNIAREVLQLLLEELDTQQDQEESSDSKADNADDDESSDSKADNADGEENSDSKADNADGEENSDSKADNADGDESSDSKGNADIDSRESELIANNIQKLLDASDEEGLEDFHKAMIDFICSSIPDDIDHSELNDNFSYIQNVNKTDTSPDRLNISQAKRLSGRVYQLMYKLLFDQVQSLPCSRKFGRKLLNNKLSGLSAGNLSVFDQTTVTQAPSAAVSLLVDSSGSMQYDANRAGITRMQIANTSALAFALAIERAGVPIEVIHYAVSPKENPQLNTNAAIIVSKPFDTKVNTHDFGVKEFGTTPTGEAIFSALNSLSLRDEDKKLLVVITDGDSDCPSTVLSALKMAEKLNVVVMPIVIERTAATGFSDDKLVSIEDASMLPSALEQAIRKKLFN